MSSGQFKEITTPGALPPPVKVPLVVVPEHACAYLPGRLARSRAFAAAHLPAELYHDFMNVGFRRSGSVFYQNTCRDCRACLPLRVPVKDFVLSKSQRRCLRKNSDIQITIDRPVSTNEKYDLYLRYITARHGGPKANDDRASFEAFLYESPVDSIEITHRDSSGQLLAIGICDISTRSLSSVYFYFDPAYSRRGLGNFGALAEIDLARQKSIPHYYLGFWVQGCLSMEYKAAYRPYEVLDPNGTWRRGDA